MQYGAFGGLSPYAMVADGASVRATSTPAFDLTAAHPQYHLVGVASQGPLSIRASPADFVRHDAERTRSRTEATRPGKGSECHVLRAPEAVQRKGAHRGVCSWTARGMAHCTFSRLRRSR